MSDTKISEFPEKALSSLDAAGTADFVGGYDVVSNNKTNKKFTFSTLANWLLTKFKLTIAGSNQTVKTAVDTLNSNILANLGTTLAANADLNTITTVGRYSCTQSSNLVNSPVNSESKPIDLLVFYRGSNIRVWQLAFFYDSTNPTAYIRVQNGVNTWTRWLPLGVDGINHNLTLEQELASGTDLNTLTTPGSFICPNGAISQTLSNWPASGIGGRLEVISILRTIGAASSERLRQIVFGNNTQDTYQRVWNGSSWGTWEKLPLRSEIDALNSNAVRSLQPVHTDFNNIPPNTVVQVSTNSAVHAPEGATTFFGIVETVGFSESGHYMTQKAYKISSGIIVGIYYRFYTGSAWEEWYKIPTRSEVDALNSKVTLTKNATGISGWSNNNSANLTVETATKIFVISIDADKSISGNIIDKS